MRRLVTVLSLVAMAMMAPLAYGQAQNYFDWYGYLQLNGLDNTAGTTGACRALLDVVQSSPMISVDTSTNEYTVVIDNMSISQVVNMGGGNYRTMWTGGQTRVFEDPSKNADYANPATFTDGSLILVGGPFTGQGLVRIRYSTGIGSFSGNLNWTGGTRLGDVPPCTIDGWQSYGGLSNRVSLPAGYIEAWDGQFRCQYPVATQEGTWGNIKSLYR